MIKVYENFDFSRVGQMQSVLEAHGISTFIRNQYGSSVMGEVPFLEVIPELYVLNDGDVQRALELLELDGPVAKNSDWICPGCGAEVDGEFDLCWKCGQGRVDD